MFCSGNRVYPPFVPGVAAPDTLDTHPAASNGAMGLNGLFGIAGAGRIKSALTAHNRTENQTVGLNKVYQDATHFFAIFCQQLSI